MHDGAGDITNDGSNAYLYDAEGRICAVASNGSATGYLYDAAGNRVAKGHITNWSCDITTNGFSPTSGYVVGPSGEQLTEVDGSGNWRHTNVYAGGKQIATYDGNVNAPSLHFYVDDPLGTRRAQTNASGVLEATYQSLPFGDGLNQIAAPGYNGDDPTENHFTGKERDAESGNDYMFARYYNSATGRFLSPDWSAKEEPVPYAKLDNPQSLNLYGYVLNNPLGKADPDGHDPWSWALAGGGTLGAAEEGAVGGGFFGGPVGAAVGAAIGATAVLLHEIPLPSGPATSVYGTGGCMACAAAAPNNTNNATPPPVIPTSIDKNSSGPKAANAPGVSAGGQATDEHGNKLGPSGKPQVNETESNTREGARNRALDEGSGATEHANPSKGKPHFHPTDGDGDKKPTSTHHNYPDN